MDTQETTLSSLQAEIQLLKSSMGPCTVLINEILECRRRRNLSENNSHTLLSLLLLELKGEVLKEMNPVFASTTELDILKESFETTTKEAFEEHSSLRQIVFNAENELKLHGTSLLQMSFTNKEHRERLDDLKLQVENKATSSNLQELRQLVKNCATAHSVEVLKNRVSDCASKYQLEEVQKNQIFFEKSLKKCMRIKVLNETFKEFQNEIQARMEAEYMNKEMFKLEKDGILKKISSENESLEETNNRINRTEAVLLKKIGNVKKQLDSCPWSDSISEIHKSLSDKVTYNDFEKYRKEVDIIISSSYKNIATFKSSIESFENILARFDEILLLKAEKDEMQKYEQKLHNFVEKSNFESVTQPQTSAIEKIQDAIKKLIKGADIMDSHLQSVSAKCNNVIRDVMDVSLIAKKLHELQEIIDGKANKEDIYEIYDIMGKKIEISQLAESDKLFKKQLELCVVLMQSLCRTLMKNGETPLFIQKKREELLNSCNSLVNWISGEMSTHTPQILLSAKKNTDFSKDHNHSVELRSRTPKSRGSNRRSSLSMRNDGKLTVDFPKIKTV